MSENQINKIDIHNVSEDQRLSNIIETLLFITDVPVSIEKLMSIASIENKNKALDIIAKLTERYQNSSAIRVVNIAGGYQMSTKPEYGRWIRLLYKDKLIARLSDAGMEVLSIVAYKQPITRAEIESIRGVDCGASIETLMEKDLIKVTGKKDTLGRPLLYGTTKEFLRLFGINKIKDLPKIEQFIKQEDDIGNKEKLGFIDDSPQNTDAQKEENKS